MYTFGLGANRRVREREIQNRLLAHPRRRHRIPVDKVALRYGVFELSRVMSVCFWFCIGHIIAGFASGISWLSSSAGRPS